MVHRGPDDEGSVHLDGVTLGMRRLSIIDLAGGHQPMHNEDSTVWVVQNGEIYNHLELRRQLIAAGHAFATQSDTEVLVHGYEEWGEQMVERLNGMFAFALLDRRRSLVVLARDRVGIKPLHYAVESGRLVFASELKALLRDPALRKGVDPVALDEYLAHEFVPSPRSIVRGIDKLRPGHTLTWSLAEQRPRLRRYWAAELNVDGKQRDRNLDEECAELRTVLRESVRKELISDVPLGVFLSGGIDSSVVTAMMTELGGDVKSFSVGFGLHAPAREGGAGRRRRRRVVRGLSNPAGAQARWLLPACATDAAARTGRAIGQAPASIAGQPQLRLSGQTLRERSGPTGRREASALDGIVCVRGSDRFAFAQRARGNHRGQWRRIA